MRRVGHVRDNGDGTWSIWVTRGGGRAYRRVEAAGEEEARREAERMAQALGAPASVRRDLTLAQWYAEFRGLPSSRGTERAANTLAYYDQQMRRNVLPRLGDRLLREIAHADLAACVRASTSPTNTKRTLSAVIGAAYSMELYPERPFSRRVPTHAPRRPRHAPWEPWEAVAAVAALESSDLWPYLALGLSGLRMEEALGARWGDLVEVEVPDPLTGEPRAVQAVRVAQTYTDGGGLSPLLKNEHSARVVPVAHYVAAGLFSRLASRVAEAEAAAGEAVGREDFAAWIAARDEARERVLGERIVPMRGDVLYHRWRRELEERGLRYIPPSHLRHASDTMALTLGVAPDLNDKMHGRAGHSATYEHYYRPSLGAMDAAARAVADALHQPAG